MLDDPNNGCEGDYGHPDPEIIRGGGASTPVALLLPMGLRRNKNKDGWDLNSKRLTTGKRRKNRF